MQSPRLAPERAQLLRRSQLRLEEPDASNVGGRGAVLGFGGVILAFAFVFLEALGPLRFVAVGVFAAVAVAGFVLGSRDHRRAEAARAAQRGWTFHEDFVDPARYRGLAPLDQPGARVGKGGLSGSHHGLPFEAFRVTVPPPNRDPKGGEPETFTLVTVPAPHDQPGFLVRRAGLGDRLVGLVGLKDIQVGDPLFDGAFVVQGTDDEAARRVLTPDVRAVLEAAPPGWLQWQAGRVAWSTGDDLTVSVVASGLEVLHHVLARVD